MAGKCSPMKRRDTPNNTVSRPSSFGVRHAEMPGWGSDSDRLSWTLSLTEVARCRSRRCTAGDSHEHDP